MSKNQDLIDRISAKFVEKGIRVGTATQGYLRLMVNLNSIGSVNSIQFPVLTTNSALRATEKRLDITDMFTITNWSAFLIKAGSSTSATDAEIAASPLYTWPNPQVFTGSGEAANLMNIYNGSMSITVDRDRVLDSYDTYRWYRVANAQKLIAQAAGTAGSGESLHWQADGWEGPSYGFSELDPQITLNGVGQNDLVLNLPSAVSLAGTSSTNFVALICRGIKWQNSSKLNA
ncbi:MAG: hypothetical protein [Bacteriophage sp.]|nr:MAG: hypothetical protein [Bacteriophage sp.]